MDSDPLVPREISPTKRYLMFGIVAALAIFLIVCMVLLSVQAYKLRHVGSAISAVALALLTVGIVLVNLWLPQDYMENKAKIAVMFMNICLFAVAIGMLIQSYQKTSCPECPKPNTCTLSGAAEGQWFSRPDCFPNDAAQNQTHYVVVSANRTCPTTPPGPGPNEFSSFFESTEQELFDDLF